MFGMLVGMNRLSTNARPWVNVGRKLLLPPTCLFCQVPLSVGDGCCHNCLEQIHIWPHSCCLHCGDLLPEELAPGPCGRCLKKAPAQLQTHSLYEYSGPARSAILQWKLQGREAGARWLVEAAGPRLARLITPDDLLLPVPMPLPRMRKSGQHHAANLCHWLADMNGVDWEWRLLRRKGEQPRQSSLSGSARRRNLRHAFILADDETVRRQAETAATIWVVDDILTTGATLHYAAKAANRLGRPVKALSLARTGHRQ